jgi:hypothetical protein
MLTGFLHKFVVAQEYNSKTEEKITSANRSSKMPEGRSLVPSEYIVFIPREQNIRQKKICVRDHKLT